MTWVIQCLAFCIITFSAQAQNGATEDMLLSKESLNNRVKTQENIFNSNYNNSQEKEGTYKILNMNQAAKDRGILNPGDQQRELLVGKTQAATMVQILQNAEMQSALEKVSQKGNDTLKNDKDLHTPAGVIAGAFALWAGRSLRVMKNGDVEVTSAVSARDRSGNINLSAPLFNGQLRFDQNNGVDIGVNRSLSSINTRAEVHYNVKTNTMSTQIFQRIAPNVDLSISTGNNSLGTAPENAARIQYHFEF